MLLTFTFLLVFTDVTWTKKPTRCSGLFGKISCFFRSKKSNNVEVIKKAMQKWSSVTCIRFVEKTNQRDYVKIKSESRGNCYSAIGRNGGEQILALGEGCVNEGTILHELAHTLGFFHEQSRPDRDSYVTINFKNVRRGLESNFQKFPVSQITDLKVPYDYGSIMHYPANAFSKYPQKNTITVKSNRKRPGIVMGQRKKLSKSDILEMKRYYRC